MFKSNQYSNYAYIFLNHARLYGEIVQNSIVWTEDTIDNFDDLIDIFEFSNFYQFNSLNNLCINKFIEIISNKYSEEQYNIISKIAFKYEIDELKNI